MMKEVTANTTRIFKSRKMRQKKYSLKMNKDNALPKEFNDFHI